MSAQVPIAHEVKTEDADVEAANTRDQPEQIQAYAVRTGTAADPPITAQPAVARRGPKPGDRVVVVFGEDRIQEFQTGWCLLPWFSFLCCFVPVVSIHKLPQLSCSGILFVDVHMTKRASEASGSALTLSIKVVQCCKLLCFPCATTVAQVASGAGA
jgi:hypothetical protein